jgi:hypothetical protein
MDIECICDYLEIDKEYLCCIGVIDREEEYDYYQSDDEEDIEKYNPEVIINKERTKNIKKGICTKIQPIISNDDSFLEAPSELLPKPPFSMLLIAKPGSGKSTTVINTLNWYKGYFDETYITSPTFSIDSSWIAAFKNKFIDEIEKKNINKTFNEGKFRKLFSKIERQNKGKTSFKDKFQSLFIFDDIVGDMPRSGKTVISNFARNHRHLGISHITLSQEWKAVPPVMRKNCYTICLYGSDNELERKGIIEELGGRIGRRRFERMWDDVVDRPGFNFLCVRPYSKKIEKKFSFNFEEWIDPYSYSNEREKKTKKEIIEEDEDEELTDFDVLSRLLED